MSESDQSGGKERYERRRMGKLERRAQRGSLSYKQQCRLDELKLQFPRVAPPTTDDGYLVRGDLITFHDGHAELADIDCSERDSCGSGCRRECHGHNLDTEGFIQTQFRNGHSNNGSEPAWRAEMDKIHIERYGYGIPPKVEILFWQLVLSIMKNPEKDTPAEEALIVIGYVPSAIDALPVAVDVRNGHVQEISNRTAHAL